MDNLRTTNRLLLVLVIPVLFYILDVLSFIFIPLMFAVFISLLFAPMMRWLAKKKSPKWLSMTLVIFILLVSFFAFFKLMQLSVKQIDVGKNELYNQLNEKLSSTLEPFNEVLGLEQIADQSTIKSLLKSEKIAEAIFGQFGFTVSFVQDTIIMILMTLFFLVLFLAGSMNLEGLLREGWFKGKLRSMKTFLTIEGSIVKFLKVKLLTSFATGLCFGLTAYFFDLSFPLFWGLFTFFINFVQMVGSVISTVLLSILAFIEIEFPGTLLAVILILVGIQVIFGSIIEPILMGQSFSINIITVLIVLMFWSYLWGVAGLILAIPITVLMKTIMGEFESTKRLARLMS